MADSLNQNEVSLKERILLIKRFPCFARLNAEQRAELAKRMREVRFLPHQPIVIEHQLVDSIYIIVWGKAEVLRQEEKKSKSTKKKIKEIPIAVLRRGESIGLSDTGFYSSRGQREASVKALTDMCLLRLHINDLYEFLKKYHLESKIFTASFAMLRMLFIKQTLPFAKISHERLQWLANQVEEVIIPANQIIFNQGDQGDKSYLIRSGQVEIYINDEYGEKHHLAFLKAPMLFGEATLITQSPRNATALTLEETHLFVLRHEYLSELIESEENVGKMFMTLMVERSRPCQNPKVSVHHRLSVEGQEITILKNLENSNYFKLSQEGLFIWEQLNGKRTLREITLNLAEKWNVFAPNVVAALVSKLTRAGFISNLHISQKSQKPEGPIFLKLMARLVEWLEVRFSYGDTDPWVSKMYQQYIRYLMTPIGRLIISIIAVLGFIFFIFYTPNILLFFSFKKISLLLILALIPFSLVTAVLHELGHAFSVKAFGREVHYIGFGWYWFVPIAFTDTSDMWLASRKPRMIVNLSGIGVDIVVASFLSILVLLFSNPYIQGMLWLFALYTYIGAFRMLSPLQEMDGYYVLMDWVDKPRLRQAAVIWLVKKFPQLIRYPSLFNEYKKLYKPEMIYWLVCIIYLILTTILSLTIIIFVFSIIDIPMNPYISLIVPFLVVVFSCLSIVAEIRNQAEE